MNYDLPPAGSVHSVEVLRDIPRLQLKKGDNINIRMDTRDMYVTRQLPASYLPLLIDGVEAGDLAVRTGEVEFWAGWDLWGVRSPRRNLELVR